MRLLFEGDAYIIEELWYTKDEAQPFFPGS